jgi:hypothetical protein
VTGRIGDLLCEARVAERPAAIRRRPQRLDEFAVERDLGADYSVFSGSTKEASAK